MTPLPPALLTLPAAGDRTLRRLHRKLALLAVRALLTAPAPDLSPERRAALDVLRRVIEARLKVAPDAVLAAVSAPDVLPGLLAWEAAVWPADGCLAEAVPHLLVALGTASEAILWPGPIPAVLREDAGRRFDPPATALLLDGSGLSVQLASGAREELSGPGIDGRWEPCGAALSRRARLALIDSNPLFELEAHPDKAGNRLDLGGRPAAEWQGELSAALDVIEGALPTWCEDRDLVLRRLVPVGYEPEMHLSASYREAPGRIYLTLHPSRLTLAEAIVHEAQHGRLNIASWLDPVLRNGRTTWTPSPVRPDLRPLMGVLLAVHAFVPVAALHLRLAEAGHPLAEGPEFARRRAQVLASNERGLRIVEELGRPTAFGARMVREIRALHDVLLGAAGDLGSVDREALPAG